MQRKARTDASGAVHPIIARGIERGKIFAVREANISQVELSRRFDITQLAVSMAVNRGRVIAAEMDLEIPELIR